MPSRFLFPVADWPKPLLRGEERSAYLGHRICAGPISARHSRGGPMGSPAGARIAKTDSLSCPRARSWGEDFSHVSEDSRGPGSDI